MNRRTNITFDITEGYAWDKSDFERRYLAFGYVFGDEVMRASPAQYAANILDKTLNAIGITGGFISEALS